MVKKNVRYINISPLIWLLSYRYMRSIPGNFVVLALLCCGLGTSGGASANALANALANVLATTEKSDLFSALATAQTESEARSAEDAIWNYWLSQSPTAEVRTLIDVGMERRRAYDYEAAENKFQRAIELAPKYAEAYNQRAFVRFLRENYVGAQADLEIALQLEPLHFGALSGLYHVLHIQDREAVALKMLQRAVELHPWIQERGVLPRELWPENYLKIHAPEQGI